MLETLVLIDKERLSVCKVLLDGTVSLCEERLLLSLDLPGRLNVLEVFSIVNRPDFVKFS